MVSAEDREKIKELMRQGMTLDGATKQIQSDHLFDVNQKAPDNAKQTETPDTIKDNDTPVISSDMVAYTALKKSMADKLPTIVNDSDISPVDGASVLSEEEEMDVLMDELIPKIQTAVNDYNVSIGVPPDYWRTKGKPQEFRGLCCYIGDTVFKDKKMLRSKPKHQIKLNGYAFTVNNEEYNIPLLSKVHDFYIRFCSSVGLPCKWGDFCLFANIPFSSRQNIELRLTSDDNGLMQKAWVEQGESIAAAAEGSRIQPVVALARLNAFHGWTKQTEIYHATQAERKSTEQIAAEMGVIE